MYTYKVYLPDLRGTETYKVSDTNEFRKKFIQKHYRNYLDRKGPMYFYRARGVGVPVYRVSNGKESFTGSIAFWISGGISWSPAKDIDYKIPVDPQTGRLVR